MWWYGCADGSDYGNSDVGNEGHCGEGGNSGDSDRNVVMLLILVNLNSLIQQVSEHWEMMVNQREILPSQSL